jgi:hypothetical protein
VDLVDEVGDGVVAQVARVPERALLVQHIGSSRAQKRRGARVDQELQEPLSTFAPARRTWSGARGRGRSGRSAGRPCREQPLRARLGEAAQHEVHLARAADVLQEGGGRAQDAAVAADRLRRRERGGVGEDRLDRRVRDRDRARAQERVDVGLLQQARARLQHGHRLERLGLLREQLLQVLQRDLALAGAVERLERRAALDRLALGRVGLTRDHLVERGGRGSAPRAA